MVAANRDANDQNRDLEAQTLAAGPTDPAASTDANAPAALTAEKATADAKAPADPKAPAVPIKRRPRFRCTCTTIVISIMFIVTLLIVCMVIGYALRHRLWPKDHRDLQVNPQCAPFLPLVSVLIDMVIQ